MPNIELHGYESWVAIALKEEIFRSLAGQPFADEIVVEIFGTQVHDAKNMSRPYVRLVTCHQDRADQIVRALRSFEAEFGGINIQHLLIAGILSC